jgi:hypothetical protein
VSKRAPKITSLTLSTDEPWDTMKAQILVKISDSLNPSLLDFNNYNTSFYINRTLPKPGLPLLAESDYLTMTKKAFNMKGNDPTVHVVVVGKTGTDDDKENDEAEPDEPQKKAKKVLTVRCMLE